MRLNRLHLVNFRQHADSRIEFDLGLTGIIGPNGAGKSTVLEAIAWALYGQSAARGTRDSIRNVRAGARAPVRVELDFDLGGHRYRVVRGLSSAELYLDGGAEPIATTITDVTDLLARRLGMTRSEFFHTYFTGQKELSVMASMPPAERARFLSRVLGYDRIQGAQGLTREHRKETVVRISAVREMMPDEQAVIALEQESTTRKREAGLRSKSAVSSRKAAEAALAVLAPRWEAAQRARDTRAALLSDLRLAENDLAALTRESDRVARELAAVTEARQALELIALEVAPLNEVLGEFQRLDELSREEGRRKTLAEALRALSSELQSLRQRHVSLLASAAAVEGTAELLRLRRAEHEQASTALETRRTEWVRDQQEASTKREALLAQYLDVKSQRDRIVDLGEDGVCPTCSRVLGDHFRTVYEGLEEQLETITVDGKYFATRLEQLEKMQGEFRALDEQRKAMVQEITDLERQLAREQAAARDVAVVGVEISAKEQRHDELTKQLREIPSGFDPARHAELEQQVARLGPLNEQLTRLGARIEREPALRGEQESLGAKRSAAAAALASLQARYEETRFSEEDVLRVKQEYEEAVATMARADLELQAAASDETRATEAASRAAQARLELERALELRNRLEADRLLHDELDRAFGDLRTDLNLQLRPELSELASDFLSELTDGRYGELEIDDDYNIVVLEDGMPRSVISGGEDDLLNLVVRLAISQMIAERSGQSFSLLVLDEVFGSLDEDKRLRVVGLLRRLLDRFEQIILLTHIEGTRDDLDHEIRIDLDPRSGSSVVKQVEHAVPDYDVLNQGALLAGTGS